MKELKTIKEVEDHIFDLEKQLFQLKNTHAFRVGMAIMSFYNKPNKVKILTAHHFINDLMAGTKKNKDLSINFSQSSKLMLTQAPKGEDYKLVANTGSKAFKNHHYYLPFLKDKVNYLTFDVDSSQGITVTPNNINELIDFGNFDEIKVDLNIISGLPNWRGFGTYDDIARTNKILAALKSNKNLKKTLIHNGNLVLFPILLDCIEVFNDIEEESVI